MPLIDPRKQQEADGFTPNVDNTRNAAKANQAGIILTYISFILIIPLLLYIATRNKLVRLQMRINEASSGIDVQLKKRKDTLTKMIDATKGSMKFEKSLLTDVTKMRNQSVTPGNRQNLDAQLGNLSSRILATFEAYPDIKSTANVAKFIDSAEQIEQEIAAARRLYNSYVNTFNTSLFTWPGSVIATGMHLSSFPLYAAAESDRQDVKADFE